jgi:hypothetical protein
MAIRYYFDHNVPQAITNGLRLREVDILTSFEDNTTSANDSEILNRATELKRVLFTRDYNLLQEAALRQRNNVPFSGVIYAHQLRISIGICIRDLEIISKAGEPEDLQNKVEFLPL